jgi:hypothetical protein
MTSRPASVAADSSVCPAKNTSAVSRIAKVSAKNGSATRENSTAADPSCWRTKRRTARAGNSRSMRVAILHRMRSSMATFEAVERRRNTVETHTKFVLSNCCAHREELQGSP